MTNQSFAEQLAKDAVDGLLKQAAKKGPEEVESQEITIDPETQKRIVEREIKMAADPDFELAEEAKRSAADRMRRSRERPAAETGRGAPAAEPNKETVNEQLRDTIKSLTDMKVAPNVIAQVIQSILTPNVTVAPAGGGAGITLADVFSILDRVNAKKDSPELTKILETLTTKIQALENKPPPVAPTKTSYILVKADGSIQEIEAGKPIILEPKPATVEGKPLEVVKEENRHDEKMEELRNDRWYKEQLADTLGGLPEQIGEGIAGRITEHGGAGKQEEGQEYLECEDCHTKIPIFADTGDKVECPKCHAIYTHKKQAETPAK